MSPDSRSSIIIFALILALLAISATDVAFAEAPPSEPVLQGAFYHFAGKEDWTQERWTQEFDWMQDLGFTTLVLTSARVENKAFYPSKIAGVEVLGDNPLDKLLSEADRRGFEIHLMPYDTPEYWRVFSPEFYDSMAAKAIECITEQNSLYGHHKSLKGFYLAPEVWFPVSDKLGATILAHYMKPVSDHIKSLNPDLIVSCAPFVGILEEYDPAAFAAFWTRLFEGAPSYDLIMLQDGIGAHEHTARRHGGRTYVFMDTLFRDLRAVCDKAGVTLWSDLEAFETVGCGYPPHITRIVNQLKAAAPHVERIVAFEASYLSPSNSVSSVEFIENYKRYLKDQPYSENVSAGAVYTCSRIPSQAYPDSGGELTDGGRDGWHYDHYVGWEDGEPVELVLDLGHVIPGISRFAGGFYNEPSKGMRSPASVEIGVSSDGQSYRPVGSFDKPEVACVGQEVFQHSPEQPVAARYIKYTMEGVEGALTLCSELAVFSEVPNWLSKGKSYIFSQEPARLFPDEGGELTDWNTAPSWYAQCGWDALEDELTMTMDLEAGCDITRVEAFFMRNDKGEVPLPKWVKVSFSDDGESFTRGKKLSPTTDIDQQSSKFYLDVEEPARFVRLTIAPTSERLMFSEFKVFGASKESR